MDWIEIKSVEELHQALAKSEKQPIALFKHSTRCSVSFMAKKTVEQSWDLDIPAYYLDLIAHRDVSNAIAKKLSIPHQSPQMIVVKDGQAIYDASHGSIRVEDIATALAD